MGLDAMSVLCRDVLEELEFAGSDFPDRHGERGHPLDARCQIGPLKACNTNNTYMMKGHKTKLPFRYPFCSFSNKKS